MVIIKDTCDIKYWVTRMRKDPMRNQWVFQNNMAAFKKEIAKKVHKNKNIKLLI